MKNECNVVRDLMPLVIDGVASEESRQYMDAHVQTCHDCALIYGEMHAALPQVNAEKESAALEKAAKAMHTKRTIRALWAVIMSMAALLIVLLVNAGKVAEIIDDTWYQLRYVGPNNELRLDAFNVTFEVDHSYSFAPYMHYSPRMIIESSPSGNRPFQPDFQIWYDEKTGEGYLQIRLIATDEESERWNTDSENFLYYHDVYGYEIHDFSYQTPLDDYRAYYPETTMYYQVIDENYIHVDNIPIYWIEIVCGDEKRVLWEINDGFPAEWKAGELTVTPTATPGVTSTPRPTFTPSVPRVTTSPDPIIPQEKRRQMSQPTATPTPTVFSYPGIPMDKRVKNSTSATPAITPTASPTPEATPAPTCTAKPVLPPGKQ